MDEVARSARELSNALRKARKMQGLSQADLAARAGLWPRTISMIETGSGDAKLETLFSLLAALDLELQVGPRRKIGPTDLEDIF